MQRNFQEPITENSDNIDYVTSNTSKYLSEYLKTLQALDLSDFQNVRMYSEFVNQCIDKAVRLCPIIDPIVMYNDKTSTNSVNNKHTLER